MLGMLAQPGAGPVTKIVVDELCVENTRLVAGSNATARPFPDATVHTPSCEPNAARAGVLLKNRVAVTRNAIIGNVSLRILFCRLSCAE